MAKNDNLTDFLADVADAIRAKKGTTNLINPQDFSAEIGSIGGGSVAESYIPQPEIYDPLYIEALESITIQFGNAYEYSRDNKTWETATSAASVFAEKGERVYLRASGLTPTSTDGIGRVVVSGSFNAGGNIMSMIYGSNYLGKLEITQSYEFAYMFSEQPIKSAKYLAMPATTLSTYCYASTFSDCVDLEDAPALPALDLQENCYRSMFYGCSNLINVGYLPASVLPSYCYRTMFYGCSSLKTAPFMMATQCGASCCYAMFRDCKNLTKVQKVLPATLATSCYENMYNGCISLEVAPELPIRQQNDVYYCYRYMFYKCSSLRYIKIMKTSYLSDWTSNWVYGVPEGGIFIKNANAVWGNVFDASNIPVGWEVIVETV